ncbi:MAG: hypothetical protein H0T83_00700 [Chthoniobacterales bacterium]|nr:hypothetical protein [Chthoniobacterales bacterium]
MVTRLLTALAILSISWARAETPDFAAAEAAQHVGETATVNAPFTAFIPTTAAEKFPDFRKLDGATIMVAGKIASHNEKAEIVVREAAQITVKEAGAEKSETPAASPAAP